MNLCGNPYRWGFVHPTKFKKGGCNMVCALCICWGRGGLDIKYLILQSLHSSYLTFFYNEYGYWNLIIYSYWLGSRTTAVLFDTRTDLLPEAAAWGQQICSRVKQNCCCPRSQSITVLLYTFILSKFSYSWSLFPLAYPLDVFKILVRQNQESGRRLDIVTLISRD